METIQRRCTDQSEGGQKIAADVSALSHVSCEMYAMLRSPLRETTGIIVFVSVLLLVGCCGEGSEGDHVPADNTDRLKAKVRTFRIVDNPEDIAGYPPEIVELHLQALDRDYATKIVNAGHIKRIHADIILGDQGRVLRNLGEGLSLTELHIYDTSNMGLDDWTSLSTMPRLERLTFASGEGVSREHLLVMAELHTLFELDLTGSSFSSPSAIRALRNTVNLERLTLDAVSGLTNESLSGLPSLRYLSLGRNDWLDDEGLRYLERQDVAWAINLEGSSSITNSQLQELRAALPDCTIFH